MAIIDILTHYDAKKKAAHAAKTVKHGVSLWVLFLLCAWPRVVVCGGRTCPRLRLPESFSGSYSLQGPSGRPRACRGPALPLPAAGQASGESLELIPVSPFHTPAIPIDTCITRMLCKYFFN